MKAMNDTPEYRQACKARLARWTGMALPFGRRCIRADRRGSDGILAGCVLQSGHGCKCDVKRAENRTPLPFRKRLRPAAEAQV